MCISWDDFHTPSHWSFYNSSTVSQSLTSSANELWINLLFATNHKTALLCAFVLLVIRCDWRYSKTLWYPSKPTSFHRHETDSWELYLNMILAESQGNAWNMNSASESTTSLDLHISMLNSNCITSAGVATFFDHIVYAVRRLSAALRVEILSPMHWSSYTHLDGVLYIDCHYHISFLSS